MIARLEPITARPIQRPDATYEVEDSYCNLLCEYVELDSGPEDRMGAQIVRVWADFGGRAHVEVPMSALSGKRLLELESLCADDAEERRALRDADHRDGMDRADDRADEWPF